MNRDREKWPTFRAAGLVVEARAKYRSSLIRRGRRVAQAREVMRKIAIGSRESDVRIKMAEGYLNEVLSPNRGPFVVDGDTASARRNRSRPRGSFGALEINHQDTTILRESRGHASGNCDEALDRNAPGRNTDEVAAGSFAERIWLRKRYGRLERATANLIAKIGP